MQNSSGRTPPSAPDATTALLYQAAARSASDVHFVPGYPITLRVHGTLEPADDAPLDASTLQQMIRQWMPPRLLERMEAATEKSFDFSVSIEHDDQPCRFRANVYLAQGQWCACLRHVPNQIPTFEWLGFSEALAQRLLAHKNGLVAITGVVGSGKSTTLAALVHLLNVRGGVRVITVEEPVEYVHQPVSTSVITQREVGRDVDSFLDGLRSGLRQDPDVILLGEIRDRETAQMALTAAETGHLILATLHTQDAKGAITRITDLFPGDAQDDVRTQLALSLRSVVSQHLLPAAQPGEKRVLALEVLHVNHPVRAGIKFGKIDSIESAIQTGRREGMISLDDDLSRLVAEGRVTPETARRFAKDPGAIDSTPARR